MKLNNGLFHVWPDNTQFYEQLPDDPMEHSFEEITTYVAGMVDLLASLADLN